MIANVHVLNHEEVTVAVRDDVALGHVHVNHEKTRMSVSARTCMNGTNGARSGISGARSTRRGCWRLQRRMRPRS